MTEPTNALAGRTALITGAARRLGRAMALALAADGADVVVHYNTSADEAQAVAHEIAAMGRRAWAIQADLSDPAAAAGLMPRAVEAAGAVNVLINNASIFRPDTVLDASAEDIAANVQIHAVAPLLLARGLAASEGGGHVINMLDSRVHDSDRKHASYHLSKRMLLDLTRMLALELAPDVAVNAVAPGLILPPAGEDESYLRRLAHTNPTGAYGSPADIADAVRFLLTSRFITGQVIYVDGGRHMKGRLHD